MSYVEQAQRVVGELYTRFLLRDLTYIAGGLLVLAVPAISHGILDRLVGSPWWTVVAAVLAAYAAGFLAQETGVALRVFRMFSPSSRSLPRKSKTSSYVAR